MWVGTAPVRLPEGREMGKTSFYADEGIPQKPLSALEFFPVRLGYCRGKFRFGQISPSGAASRPGWAQAA